MYALSLGFIIFINVSFSVSVNSFTYGIQQQNGVRLSVRAQDGFDEDGQPWQMGDSVAPLEQAARSHEKVAGFAWITANLKEVLEDVEMLEITNIGHYFVA